MQEAVPRISKAGVSGDLPVLQAKVQIVQRRRKVDQFIKGNGNGLFPLDVPDEDHRWSGLFGQPFPDPVDAAQKAFAQKRSDALRLRLLSDLTHMQVNRCFAAEQGRNELDVWVYVAKFLKSAVHLSSK